MAQTTSIASHQPLQEQTSERSAMAIRREIEANREGISETIDKLGERINQTLDWHQYVAEYPAIALGLAAGAGFLLAAAFKRHPTPQERILDAVADLTEDMTDRIGGVVSGMIQRRLLSGGTLKTAAAALAAKAAVEFFKNQIHGATAGGESRPGQPIAHNSTVSPNPNTSLQPSNSLRHVAEG